MNRLIFLFIISIPLLLMFSVYSTPYSIHFTGFESDSTSPYDGWVDGGIDCRRISTDSYCTDDVCSGGGSYSISLDDDGSGASMYQTFDLLNQCDGSSCDSTVLSFWAFFRASWYTNEYIFVNCDGSDIWTCYPKGGDNPAGDSPACSGDMLGFWTFFAINLTNPEKGTCTLDSSVTIRIQSATSEGYCTYFDGVNITGYYYIPVSDTCTPPASGDWTVDCNDNCTLSDNTYLSGSMNLEGSNGNFTLDAHLSMYDWNISGVSDCDIHLKSGSTFNVTSQT